MNNDKKDFQNENEIEDLLKSATESEVTDNIETKELKKKKTFKNTVFWASAGTGLFIAALIVGPMLTGDQEKFVDKTETPDWVGTSGEKQVVETNNERWDFEYPIEIESWAKKEYDRATFWLNEEDVKGVYDKGRRVRGLMSSLSVIPSGGEGHGYDDPDGVLSSSKTSDLTKQYNEDGSLNRDFYYALREDYIKSFVINTERLLNPVFGSWVMSQNVGDVPDVKSSNRFEGLESAFSSTWWKNNINLGTDASKLPIMADWNNNNWGGIELKEKDPGQFGSFYGQIRDDEESFVSSTVKGMDENGMPIIEFKVPVQFTAFTVDDKEIKKGTLTITLKSNSDSLDEDKRVVIDSANLELE